MAVVVAPKDRDEFLKYAAEENLEATEVAVVTEEPRLVLNWRGKKIVNIARAFLDTNGAHQETTVSVEIPEEKDNYLKKIASEGAKKALDAGDTKGAFKALLHDLNVCSQKGLVEMFDASIGAGSVLMPYGGRLQQTETQAMVAKLPVLHGDTETVTMMSYGFDPYLSSWSPYHGAVYAVTESIARIVANGGDHHGIHFTFQEYFKRMTEDPKRWSAPFTALLGAFEAQMKYGYASIGGKDSMSGSFNEINVPPTLVSFAVDVAKQGDIVTPELKKAGNALIEFIIDRDAYDLPVYDNVLALYDEVTKAMRAGRIVSCYAEDTYGIAASVSKMAFGNAMGVKLDAYLSAEELLADGIGNLIAEVPAAEVEKFLADPAISKVGQVRRVGEVTEDGAFTAAGVTIPMNEMEESWTSTLEKVFPTTASDEKEAVATDLYRADSIYVCKHKTARPTVFIPVFPGTNCEYDSAAAFEKAGADVITKIFRNQNEQDIRESVEEFEKSISQAQIIMFPGGFSAGDEPDGSAKFFATAFRNAKIAEAVHKMLNERDGLALGICNGFQAMIKLGLVPNGSITGQTAGSPTLTFNTIGRHISHMAYIKVVSNKSPWLQEAELGGVYTNPASHGEGRFVASPEVLERLFANGQVAFQYCDTEGNVTMDDTWNINGSYMAVEGITSPDGRCLGKMAHAERRGDHIAMNIYGEQDLKLFASGVKYFS